jgi:hypothetical protein
MMLRLVKVMVQPIYAIDDGESLTEQIAQPFEVAAKDWPDFPSKLEEQRAELEAELGEAG